MSPKGADIALYAYTQLGKPYSWAIEVDLDDPDPPGYDCSELMQWSIWHAGKVLAPDGSWVQQRWCYLNGGSPAFDMAATRAGILVFRLKDRQGRPLPPDYSGPRPATAHVGVTDGHGNVIEALNRFTGVHRIPYRRVQWTSAFTVPQFDYTPTPSTPVDDNQGDDEVSAIYVKRGDEIWRVIGNTAAHLSPESWEFDSALSNQLGKPITLIDDSATVRAILDGRIDTDTGHAIRT